MRHSAHGTYADSHKDWLWSIMYCLKWILIIYIILWMKTDSKAANVSKIYKENGKRKDESERFNSMNLTLNTNLYFSIIKVINNIFNLWTKNQVCINTLVSPH